MAVERALDGLYKLFGRLTFSDFDKSFQERVESTEGRVTSLENYRTTQSKVFRQLDSTGDGSLIGVTSIPTTPGVYRVTSAIAGLPEGAGGYGTILVFYSGYYIFIYVNYNQDFYYAQTSSGTPTKWYKVTGTEVGLTT